MASTAVAVEASMAVVAVVVSMAAAWVDFMVAEVTLAEAVVTMAGADTGVDPTTAAADIIMAEVTMVGAVATAGVAVTGGMVDMAGAADIGVTRGTVMDGASD
ncbi:MAG: hypothetical protein WAM58_23745 [Candidatus Acidiferrum sp.]